MNGDLVKRIVALTRQKKSYNAMVKTGDLTRAEADAMIAIVDREIAEIRVQAELAVSASGSAPAKGAKSA